MSCTISIHLRQVCYEFGWPDLADWHAWLEQHFQQRKKLTFLRQLTAYYESRPALEAEILTSILRAANLTHN